MGGEHDSRLSKERLATYIGILDNLLETKGRIALQEHEDLIGLSFEELDELPDWKQLNHDF